MNDQSRKTHVPWLIRSAFLIGLLLLILAPQTNSPIQARPSDKGAALSQYPQLAETRLDDCGLCHTSDMRLNTYGRDYASSEGNFVNIESLDSDGDGFTNRVEINALTLPGSAEDFPQLTLVYIPYITAGQSETHG